MSDQPQNTINDMQAARQLSDHGARIETLEERSKTHDEQIGDLIVQSTRTNVLVANLVKIVYIVLTAITAASVTVIVRDFLIK